MTKNPAPAPRVSCAPPPADGSVAPPCPQPVDLDVSRETCHAQSMINSAARVAASMRAARVAAAFQASADFDLEAL